MASGLATSCCNASYDILTIFISIADVATDIIVLIDFYNKNRMTFFGISLSILILAQCSYSIACAVRFNTINRWKVWESCVTFFCCLPFGTCVAFLIYFSSEESTLDCMSQYLSNMDLTTDGWFTPKPKDSKLVKFIKQKLDKVCHLFISTLFQTPLHSN